MQLTQTEIEQQIIKVFTKALNAFCLDISQMFGVEMSCNQTESHTEVIKNLREKFGTPVAVISVESEGTLEGNFRVIFDKRGLFTLAGVIVMLPEQRILDNGKFGSAEDAGRMSDTIGEAGNLLVGAWDRIFREELEDHGHLVQLGTFIGNPWNDPDEKIGLNRNEELLYVLHEVTIGSYPPFKCGIVFPKTIIPDALESDTEATTDTDEPEQEKTQEVDEAGAAAAKAESAESDTETTADTDEPEQEKTQEVDEAEAVAAKTESAESDESQKNDDPESEPQESTAKEVSVPEEPQTENAAKNEESKAEQQPEPTVDAQSDTSQQDNTSGNVREKDVVSVSSDSDSQKASTSENITRMTSLPTNLCEPFAAAAWTICAKDIMQKKLVWASGDDTVEQALAKMEEAGSGYLIAGKEGVIEGIISRFDLAGAMSPYLRPIFDKWRRPLDDATLRIRIKWIMSRPVRTVKPETPFPAIIENMCRCDGHCLPVVDKNGTVQGVITTSDVFSALLRALYSHPRHRTNNYASTWHNLCENCQTDFGP